MRETKILWAIIFLLLLMLVLDYTYSKGHYKGVEYGLTHTYPCSVDGELNSWFFGYSQTSVKCGDDFKEFLKKDK